jgi:phenylpropionate dioxygenase-like ring-hydroxylating dioxygenase large terminal subunit
MSRPAPMIDGVELVPPAPGRNLPPRAFTSRAVFDLEQRAIFARSWIHVADVGDLPNPGDYATAMIGATPVVIVRDRKTSELRGFLNACRHRGAQLLEGKGACDKQIKCPYHAWSYGLDGKLLGVPYREEFEHDVSQMGLVPVRVGTVGPLVMACIDPTAPALDEWVGDLPAAMARAGTDGWEFAWELTYELDANWKLFVENANDGLHVQFVHDLLADLLLPDGAETTLEPHSAYTMANINPAYVPPDRDPALAKVRFGCIFPNLIPVLSPSDLTYIRVDPIAHDRLRLFVRSYDLPEFSAFREFRKTAFQHTTNQDIAVVQRTFRGLHAEGLPAGVHASRLEARIGHLERMWAEAMARDSSVERAGSRLLAAL